MGRVKVHQRAPEFTLEDYKGIRFQLSDFQEKKNVLIVLNRGFV